MLTATELDAMPVGRVVLDRDGDKWRKRPAGSWGHDGSIWPSMSLANYGAYRLETHVEQPMPTASTGTPMLTATELDAMPIGQVVLDKNDEEWTASEVGWARQRGMFVHQSKKLVAHYGPIRRRETHVEQPMPTASTGPSMHDLAVQVHGDRAQTGLERYGQPLRAMNGRDAVRDTIEELADGLAYALQIREERRLLRAELGDLREMLVSEAPSSSTFSLRLDSIITRYFPKETS